MAAASVALTRLAGRPCGRPSAPPLQDPGPAKAESVTQAPGLKCYLDNRSNNSIGCVAIAPASEADAIGCVAIAPASEADAIGSLGPLPGPRGRRDRKRGRLTGQAR